MFKIFILYGDDLALAYQNLDKIENEIRQNTPNIQFQSFSETTPVEINNFLDNGSLFGDLFCIKIKKLKGNLPLAIWKETPHIFIIHSEDDKDPFPKDQDPTIEKISCTLPKSWDLIKIIQKSFGSKIDLNAAEYLSNTISSMTEIEDIKKQMNFYNIGKLDLESLEILLPAEDVNSFSLAEYFFIAEKHSLFLHGVQTLIKRGISLDTLISTLLKKTKDFIEIKRGLIEKKPIATIAREIKLHPFIVEKMMPTVTLYSPKLLKDLIIRIVDTQFLSRFYSSQMDFILITRLLLEQKELSFLHN